MSNNTSKQGSTIDNAAKLTPLNWQQGNVAMSPTHFYTVYMDKKEGLSVRWNNRITNESNQRHSFASRDDANDWILNVHHAKKQEEYDASGFSIGQRWVDRVNHKVIVEVLDISMVNEVIYTRAYSENNPDDTSGIIENNIHEFRQFIAMYYLPMLEGENICDCLLRLNTQANR